MRHSEKALVYARSARGLLVFDEPDFPEVPLQVPGGTIDRGETPMAAAHRAFAEETGLILTSALRPLGEQHLVLDRIEGPVHLLRHLFAATLPEGLPGGWKHWETGASNGAAPIRFRLFWLPLAEAVARLGRDMDEGARRLMRLRAATDFSPRPLPFPRLCL